MYQPIVQWLCEVALMALALRSSVGLQVEAWLALLFALQLVAWWLWDGVILSPAWRHLVGLLRVEVGRRQKKRAIDKNQVIIYQYCLIIQTPIFFRS